ncbi:glycosyltransferase family 4 protein [Ferrimonas gelatinilytica]|uniref:Glycosyl transferase family 1 domain-containing protein n=1 Tax=Ferrimonas gelatinilytica TaxID=1255257 RepID=A0ABP9SDD1_9GAMM
MTERTIVVLFSLGMSAIRWHQMGIFGKEKVLSEAYLKHGLASRVVWLSYHPGDPEFVAEQQRQGQLASAIEVLPAPSWAGSKLGRVVYSLTAPWQHRKALRQATAIINNQTSGCWTGLIARAILGSRFVYRYGHSLWRRHLDRKQYGRLMLSWPVDRLALAVADHTLVCTRSDARHARSAKTLSLCPNFIDTDALPNPPPVQARHERGIFVGRLMSFKNLFNLISACAAEALPLDIYGDGPLASELKAHADTLKADVQFHGVCANEEVRSQMMRCRYHFLVSNYEAMPKALLEGMAAGCVCLVSPNYGCAEIIDDGDNGLMASGFEVEDLRALIRRAREADQQALSDAAVAKIISHYSLRHVVGLHRQALLGEERE